MELDEATAAVRAAIAAGHAPKRRDIEHAVRAVFGLSARQARRFAAEGVKAFGAGEEAADMRDLVDRIKALELRTDGEHD
jgi:hypothetical protein